MEMIGPKPADVATAAWIGKPNNVSSDTTNMPPPMLIKAETTPMTAAVSSSPKVFGSASPSRQSSRPNAIFDCHHVPATTHTHFSAGVLALFAVNTPSTTPSATHGPRRLTTARSSAPFCQCPRADLSNVGTMTASEVPSTMCMRTALVDTKHCEQLVQHRHENSAAADTQEAGKKSGDQPRGRQRERQRGEVGRGHQTMSFIAYRQRPTVPAQ